MKAFNLILIVLLMPSLVSAQKARKKVSAGNKLFAEQKYDEANNKYRDALIDNPKSPEILFNIGNTQYKKKKYEEAITEFEKSLSTDDVMLQSKAYYNMGNSLYRMGKLPESILAYTQALKLNPDDMDAKYNLEYVRKKLKDQAQKQQMNNKQQQQQQEKQQPENKKNKEQQNQQQQMADQQKDQQRKQPNKNQEISREDAERILNALQNDEKDLQKQRKVKTSGKVRVLKDW